MTLIRFFLIFLLMPSLSEAKEVQRNFEVEVCSKIFEYQGEIYFCGEHRRLGKELFRSNGSAEGTFVVADIDIGLGGSNPRDFFILRDKLYFTAETASTGREIWRTDGTNNGTKKVSNAYSGSEGFPRVQEVLQGDRVAYLSTEDGLWRTDGSQAGTGIILGPESYTLIASMNGALYFSNKNSYFREEEAKIFKFEESATQKELVRNFGSECTYDNYIGFPGRDGQIVQNNKFYFNIACGSNPRQGFVFASDGTQSGTKKVINGGASFLGDVNGYRYFYNREIDEIQYTDGATTLTLALCGRIAECSSGKSGHGYPRLVNGKFVFGLSDENFRRTIWATDGTVAGSEKLASGNFGEGLSNGHRFLFRDFFENDAVFSTDGSRAGTYRVKKFGDGRGSDIYSLENQFLILHTLPSPSEYALWVSSGTASSTKKLALFKGRKNFSSDGDYIGGTTEGSRFYFSFDYVLWHSDGTIDGTYKITYLDTVTIVNEAPKIEYFLSIIDLILDEDN